MEETKEVQEENVTKVSLKKKPEETVHKVDLNKKDNAEESTTDDTGVVGSDEATDAAPQQEEVQAESEAQETPVLEEVTEEEPQEENEETAEEIVAEEKPTVELPENVEKLVEFINETGGTVEDYVRLNQDYSQMDNLTALEEYYKITKPHLDVEERKFLMDETFSYDEEVDDDKDIRKKKIALKEQVAEAKAYLDRQKSKYYEEIKAGSKLTNEQQKAIDFFNRYNKESESAKQTQERNQNVFNKKTSSLFSDKFKGFEYNLGEKKFRFNVKNVDSVKETQSDIGNFIKKFLNKEGSMEDAAGYHKGLYTAMNADAIAQHFYEQGKADALKTSVEKSKNINMDPRQTNREVKVGGSTYRVLSGESTSDFKVKIKRGRK
tara:strand:- start:458 stop:1594 length:1137 start_codon:yes stop_codon:yes gene_type:complete